MRVLSPLWRGARGVLLLPGLPFVRDALGVDDRIGSGARRHGAERCCEEPSMLHTGLLRGANDARVTTVPLYLLTADETTEGWNGSELLFPLRGAFDGW